MEVLSNWTDNAYPNCIIRKEMCEWVGGGLSPTSSGIFYVKLIYPDGRFIKSVCEYSGTKWLMGSGELAGLKVYEWLDDRPDDPTPENK